MNNRERPFMSAAELAGLVQKAKTGDRDALDAVLRSFWMSIYGWALSFIGNTADAEDVCQEVCLIIARRVSTVKKPGNSRAGPG
jgi:DNA-directed RNA polymerase specialized sigma24 family protein